MSSTRNVSPAPGSGHGTTLRREVCPPRTAATAAAMLLAGSCLASFAVVVTAIGLGASARSERPQPAPAVVHIIHGGDTQPGATLPAVGVQPAEPAPAEALPPGAEASLVTELGGRAYAVLAPAPDELLDADAFAIAGDAFRPEGAWAPVDAGELPGELAAWDGREVIVGGDCRARVEGFAVISPMTGKVDYMPTESWDPETREIVDVLLDVGAPVLAAKLDGCADGHRAFDAEPVFARDAALGPVAEAEVLDRPKLTERALAHLLDSDRARAAQREYAGVREDAVPWWKLPSAEIEGEALRHPATGELLISVHASADEGCGLASVNLWGLYGIDGDGAIELREIHELEPGTRLHAAADVDGDGELTWLASRFFGGTALLDAAGEARAEIDIPHFGCVC